MLIKPQAKRFSDNFSRNASRYLIIVIFIASFAVYFNALFNGFVYDDDTQVLLNPWIKDIKYFPQLFSKSVWSFQGGTVISNYFRPVMHIIYMVDYHIFGLNPWGFHLVNILFHAGVSSLVFVLSVKLLREYSSLPEGSCLIPSFIAAMLFVVQPIHTEAVTWIAGVPELSFTFFCLLSFYFYMRSTDEGFHRKAYWLSVSMFAIAVLCKETALTFPIILVAYDYGLKRSANSASASLKRYAPYLLVAGIYFAMRFHALGGIAPDKRYADLTGYQLVINAFYLFKQYLVKLLFPMNLNAFHVFHPLKSIFEPEGILSLCVVLIYLAVILRSMRINRLVFFGVSLILIPLLPVFYVPALGENTFAERYLYLPSFGFVILAALFIAWARVSFPRRGFALNIIFILLIGLYSTATVSRNFVWKDDYTLFTDTVMKSPDGAVPQSSFATALLERGEIDRAIKHYRIALSLQPKRAGDHYNLGVAYVKKGLMDKAIEEFKIAGLAHGFAKPHNNLGVIYAKRGSLDKAIEEFKTAIRFNPAYANAHNNLGMAYEDKGLIDKAVEQFKIAVRFSPDNSQFRGDLSRAERK